MKKLVNTLRASRREVYLLDNEEGKKTKKDFEPLKTTVVVVKGGCH